MEPPRTGEASSSPSPGEYLAGWAHLVLTAIGVDLAGRFSDQLHGQTFGRPAAWALAGAALAGVAWVSGATESDRRRAARRSLGAVAIGFGASLAALSPFAPLAAAAVAGLAAGPEVALLVAAHRARGRAGHPFVFPEGLPRGRLLLLFVSPLVVLAAAPLLSAPRTGLLAGIAAGLWALASTSPHPQPQPMDRLKMAAAALPPLVLGVVLLGPGPLLIGVATVPVLLWRVRRFAVLAAGTTLLLAGSLSLATARRGRAPAAGGFEMLRSGKVVLPGGRQLSVTAALHRDTGAVQVFAGGMVFFTDQNDPRLSEGLVHPVMALAPRRRHILAVGAECNGILRELAKYEEIQSLDLVSLHPGIDAFCRSVPVIRQRLGPRPVWGVREFRFTELESLVKAVEREAKRYDVILVFGPHPPLSPPGLHSGDFYTLLRGLLAPDGLLAARLGGFSAPALPLCGLSRLQERFPHLLRYHLHGAGGTAIDHHLYAIATRVVPQGAFRIRVPTRVITREIFRAAEEFPKGVRLNWTAEPPGGCAALGRLR